MSANFAHAAFDNPKESFGQVAVTLLGPKGFPKTKYGALFKRECRKVSAMHSQWKRVYEISVAIAVALTLAACASTDPQSPHPEGFPGDKWEAYTVKSYRNTETKYTYNPFDKQNEIWQEYSLTLESKKGIRLTLTCGQWKMPEGFDDCGHGAFTPNENVWTRAGVSGEQLWVYSNKHPEKGLPASFWHIESSEAK